MWSLQRQIDLVHNACRQQARKVERLDRDAADLIEYDAMFEVQQRTEELYEIQSHWLKEKARHLYITVPKLEWENGEYGSRFLTADSRAKLDAAVREQRDKRRDFWLRVIGALTGVIGALIGLFAFLKKAK
jgi:hypothetical protein